MLVLIQAQLATYSLSRIYRAILNDVELAELVVPHLGLRRPGSIPSAATIYRHAGTIGWPTLVKPWRRMFEHQRAEIIDIKGHGDEFAHLQMDGVRIEISRKTDDSGFLARTSGLNGSGHGYTFIFVVSQHGIVLGYQIAPNGTHEAAYGAALLDDLGPLLRDLHTRHGYIPTITADGGFSTLVFRDACRRNGLLENTHGISHGSSETS